MTGPQPSSPSHHGRGIRQRWLLPGLLLLGGATAWIVTLAGILLAARPHDPPSLPPVELESIAQRRTLAAATQTPLITDTPVPSSTQLSTSTPATPAPAIPPPPSATLSTTPAAVAAGEIQPTLQTAALASACTPPEGWERYVVQPGDTLFAFVVGAGGTLTVDDLVAANCLTSRWLQVDQVLFLPPGAADNAPSSDPYVPPSSSGGTAPIGPRTPNCPCSITIAEGWRREQVADAINAAATAFTGADFLTVTGPGAAAPFDFVMERPAGASMEGYMFPGTYTVQNDTTAEGFRDMLLAAFAANVSPQVRADATAQGVTFYQALIIASIVQREVRSPEPQKLAASVYYNRYREGSRLGNTLPISYVLGAPGNWWPRISGSSLELDSPYNTWSRPGLPPTPIDSPGLSAILASVYPPQTNYYFHTAACDGSGEVFAETYEEHLANATCE